MVNRYDNPAQAQFINTYVPIPFEQLYNLGKDANARVDKAMADYSTALDKWSDFKSQSAKDMQTWYNETVGRAKPVIEEMANNLDMIKTPEGRMKLYSIINNVDRAKLSGLKQSAENFEAYNKAKQALIAAGKYNPLWHDRDFTNWDTTTQGLYKDISPLAYASVNDLVHPYVNDLKPNSMGSKGRYRIHGVSEDRTKAQVDAHLSEILSTPQAQMHMKTLVNSGYTPEQARDTFIQQAYTAAKEKAWVDEAGVDQYAYLNAKLRASNQEPSEQSRPKEIFAKLALNRELALANSQEELMKNGELTEQEIQTNPNEAIRKVYSNIYRKALTNPNEARRLMDSQSVNFSKSEFKLALSPVNPDEMDVDVKLKGEPDSKRIRLNDLTGAVAMTSSGIPVAEISKEFIANDETNLLKTFKSFGPDGSLQNRKKKIDDLLNNYGNIVETIMSNLSSGYMQPSGKLQDYAIISDNGVTQLPLATGKILVPATRIDEILEANKGSFGDLSNSDIKKILFKDGIAGKHIIGKELKDKPIIDGEEASDKFYELNIGYPVLYDEAQVKIFDDAVSAKIFGGSSSYKSEQSHAGIAFDNRRTNSNM